MSHPAITYLTALFEPTDRVCLQLIHQKSRHAPIRIMTMSVINDRTMENLAQKNSEGYNVYVCMNPIVAGGERRTKEFVGEIRTAYIEIDNDALVAIDNIDDSVFIGKIPEPQFILESSPGKRQVIWKLAPGVTVAQQEALNRALMLRFGGDPACVDAVRVLRLPGFRNHKYDDQPKSSILVIGDGSSHTVAEFELPLEQSQAVVKPPAEQKELQTIADFMDAALKESGISYSGPRAWGSLGYLWELDQCAWAADHSTGPGGACIVMMNSGALSYSCRHGSCLRNLRNWTQFRELIEKKAGHVFAFAEKKDWSSGVILVSDGPDTPAVEPTVSALTGYCDDMPDAVLSGRLGEICQKRMLVDKRFPIAYAWPALVSAAGVMVPPIPPDPEVVRLEPMTNLFTGLVGPVHSGKSQAIYWANSVIGLPREYYSDTRAGSSESLLRKLMGMKKKGTLMRSIEIDLDEWAHLFGKASIEAASFNTFMTTAWDKSHASVILGGGFEVDLTCSMTFIGGIVEDDFGACFGAKSMGGLHDRFIFGLAPRGYDFMYRPWEGKADKFEPVMVSVDKDVHEMIDAIRKETGAGREAQNATRIAHICAAYDGRIILKAKDCEASVRAFIQDQIRIRKILRPNEGVTHDASMSNDIMVWMRAHAPNGEIVAERSLKHGIRRSLARFGPGIFHSSVRNLVQAGALAVGEDPNGKLWGGRKPKVYQLCVEEK